MSKFQIPMLNDEVCTATTDKQTHKQKHTHRVETEVTFFFYFKVFMFSIFVSLIHLKAKKVVSKNVNITQQHSFTQFQLGKV